jgi:hypothetical protein
MNKSISGFGVEFELKVSKDVAQKYAGKHWLPEIGYEIELKSIKNGSFTTGRLSLQNVSGIFVLASNTHARKDWDCFGINLPH